MNVELARHHWSNGHRAVERYRRDDRHYDDLNRQIAIVTAELTRRIGQVFTLDQLAEIYGSADHWALAAIHDALPDEIPSQAAIAADAAFQFYSHRASDYTP